MSRKRSLTSVLRLTLCPGCIVINLVRHRDAPGTANGRAVLRIAGCPGAGKSTLAELLVAALDPGSQRVAHVPMDGFHFADAALGRSGLRQRKGAIDRIVLDD